MSSLYILNINPLSDISFANVFSHLIGCLVFLIFFSSVQKLFILVCCNHLYLFLLLLPLPKKTDPKTILPRLISKILLPMFSFRSFMGSGLTYKSLIPFEFIFCIWCKKEVQFHPFACNCPVFPTPFIEKPAFN